MNSFYISIEVLCSPPKRLPVTLTSLLMVTSVTNSPGIVKHLFPQSLAPRPKVSKSEKVYDFVIDKFVNSSWC